MRSVDPQNIDDVIDPEQRTLSSDQHTSMNNHYSQRIDRSSKQFAFISPGRLSHKENSDLTVIDQ